MTTEYSKPSEALKEGKCPYCLGVGLMHSLALNETRPCRYCKGTGDLIDTHLYILNETGQGPDIVDEGELIPDDT